MQQHLKKQQWDIVVTFVYSVRSKRIMGGTLLEVGNCRNFWIGIAKRLTLRSTRNADMMCAQIAFKMLWNNIASIIGLRPLSRKYKIKLRDLYRCKETIAEEDDISDSDSDSD
jgi:hypothetical protein